MSKVFEPLRSPTRFQNIFRQYPFGSHWKHACQNLTVLTVLKLNDLLIDDVDIRHSPRLSLSQVKGDRCVLTLSLAKRRKRVPITLRENSIFLGDDPIFLGNPDGPMQLVNALIGVIENFWNSDGR